MPTNDPHDQHEADPLPDTRDRDQLAAMAAQLDELRADLAGFNDWLAANVNALAAAGAVTPGFNSTSYPADPPQVSVKVQCPTVQALGAVTRIMVRGAGKGGVTKDLGTSAQVTRRFGRVTFVAWIVRDKVCTPLTGAQVGWDCAAFLSAPLLDRTETADA